MRYATVVLLAVGATSMTGSAWAQGAASPPSLQDLQPRVNTSSALSAGPAPAHASAPAGASAASGSTRTATAASQGPPSMTKARARRGHAHAASAQRPQASAAATDRLQLGTTQISGNRELPKLMYIVPWNRPQIGAFAGRPPNSLVDEALTPVDRAVFERQNRYYAALQSAAAAPPNPATASVPPSGRDEK